MFKINITETQVEKLVLWLAKGATLVVSAPATLYVVSLYYKSDIKLVQILVQFAALLLIEGAFLYSWQRLENKKKNNQDSEDIKPYVIGAWFMYAMLLGMGIVHGEGPAALFMRASIGLLLYYGTRDTLNKMTKREDQSLIAGDKLSRKAIKAAKEANEEIQLAVIHADKEARLEALNESTDLVADVAATKVLSLLQNSGMRIKVQQNVANLQQISISAKYDNLKGEHFENDMYTVTRNGTGFYANCKVCGKQEHRETYISAVRFGAAHCRNHS